MLATLEAVGGGLVEGKCPAAGGGIGGLAGMELTGGEAKGALLSGHGVSP
jgi:hypothetical protein